MIRRTLMAAFVLALLPAAADAATKKVTVTGDRVISTELNPASLGDCSTIVFYEWSDVKNTSSATVTFTNRDNNIKYSETRAAPFDDVLSNEKPPRYAPPGRHRIVVGWGYGSGAAPNYGCRDVTEPKFRKAYPPTAKVELTVEVDEAACNKAKAKLKKRSQAVREFKRKLEKATGNKKNYWRSELRKAKKKKDAAADKVKEVC